jgi:hypothetical protein
MITQRLYTITRGIAALLRVRHIQSFVKPLVSRLTGQVASDLGQGTQTSPEKPTSPLKTVKRLSREIACRQRFSRTNVTFYLRAGNPSALEQPQAKSTRYDSIAYGMHSDSGRELE